MRILRNTFYFLMITANLAVGIGYEICAFSPYFSPTSHPVLSLAGLCIPFFILANCCFLIYWLIFNRRFAAIPIAFFLIGWNALRTYIPLNFEGSPKGEKTLKVLTYNTQGMLILADENGKYGVPTLDYVKASGADIVCLQEFPAHEQYIIDSLKELYPYLRIVSFAPENSVACLSKYPILSAEKISMKSSHNGAALYRMKVGDRTIPFIVNHLESNKLSLKDKDMYKGVLKAPKTKAVSPESKHLVHKLADAVAIRGLQADKVAQQIKKINDPYIVVCGDFNDTPISYVRRVIAEGLQDAFVKRGTGPGITYNKSFMFFRIDHMMVGKGYHVIKCKVDRSIDASDHYPMWCELEF